jgi:hypothetical protein
MFFEIQCFGGSKFGLAVGRLHVHSSNLRHPRHPPTTTQPRLPHIISPRVTFAVQIPRRDLVAIFPETEAKKHPPFVRRPRPNGYQTVAAPAHGHHLSRERR